MGNFLSSFGATYSLYGAVVATIFFVILIAIGIFLVTRKDAYTKYVKGMVLKATCNPEIQNQTINYVCSATVQYVVDKQTYVGVVSTTLQSPLTKGDTLELAYNPANPKQVEAYTPFTSFHVGLGFIIVGILFIIGVWFNAWLTQKSKTVAGFEGIEGLAGLIRG